MQPYRLGNTLLMKTLATNVFYIIIEKSMRFVQK